MTLKEGIKHKGHPYLIRGCTRNDLPEFFRKRGYKVGAEIGVYKGEFTTEFCKAGLKIYGIDPWGIFKDYPSDEARLERQEFLRGHAKRVLAPYDNKVLIRKISMDAVQDFELESLDFVYIDGNHKFRYVAEDIYEWSKRVRKGGIVSGHDYFNTSNYGDLIVVKNVVDAYVKSYKIDPWYVFGGTKDRWPSWMWIKE